MPPRDRWRQQIGYRSLAALAHAERLGNCGRHQRRVAQRPQLDPGDTVGKILRQCGGDGGGQPGLADPTGAGEGQETNLGTPQQGTRRGDLALTPHQGCRGDWQIRQARREQDRAWQVRPARGGRRR